MPFIAIALNLDYVARCIVYLRHNFAVRMTLLVLVSLAVLLSAMLTSSLTQEIKLAVAITAVLGGLICLAVAVVGRLSAFG